MRRGLSSLVVAVCVVFASASAVTAISAAITPATQSHAHNVASHWTGSWTGRVEFDALFQYGDGTQLEIITSSTSHSYSHTFSPCPGDAITFPQLLEVWDNVGHGSSLFASSTSTATESAGTPC